MASNYIPSDGTLHRFTQENLLDAQIALFNAKAKHRSIGSVPVVVDTNSRHNKTSDTIISMSDYDQNNVHGVVVLGTEAADTFANHGAASFIWGDSGNDKIRNHQRDVTISGGAGDDLINLPSGSLYKYEGGNYHLQYKNGDGDDTVGGWYKFDTLYIEGDYSTEQSGSDFIVNVGNGSILFKDPQFSYSGINIVTVPAGTFPTATTTSGGGSTSTTTGSGKNISNSTSNKIITGTAYNDSIYNSAGGSYVTINGADGKDTIENFGDTVKIDGGAGNDSIYSYSYYSTISGGKDNDSLSGGSGKDKLYGGKGNDVFIYRTGEAGTDTIFDYLRDNMLQILNANGSNGSFFGATFSGNKLTLAIDGGGSVIFSGVSKGDTFNINGKTYMTYGKTIKSTSKFTGIG